MTQPDDHTLNACLARVIGKEVHEANPGQPCWFIREDYVDEETGEVDHYREIWDPLHHAIQMELVEAHLMKAVKQYEFYTAWCPAKGLWEAFLSEYGTAGRPVFHPNKKRAFALAVQAMEQAKNQ